MNKVTLLMAIAISTASVLAMILAPTAMITNVAKAYSCSSSTGSGSGFGTSTQVTGTTGSCSTSSSSSGTQLPHIQATCLPNPAPNCNLQVHSTGSSASSGGSRTTCSSSHADVTFAFSSSHG